MDNCDSEAVAAVASANRTEFVSEEFDIFKLLKLVSIGCATLRLPNPFADRVFLVLACIRVSK
jgi:hypothetical protein